MTASPASTVSWALVAAALLLAGRGRCDPADDGAARGQPATLARVLSGRGLSGRGLSGRGLSGRGLSGRGLSGRVLSGRGLSARGLPVRAPRSRATSSLALAFDLVSAALHAGQSLAGALLLAAPAAEGRCGAELARVGGLLKLGADPADAWRVAGDDPVLAPAAAAARRSATSGIRLAATFSQLAVETRAQRRAAATARAERAGVFAAAPLGLCFLPSFVCLGIVPTVISVAGAAVSGLG